MPVLAQFIEGELEEIKACVPPFLLSGAPGP